VVMMSSLTLPYTVYTPDRTYTPYTCQA
jgi:hypothetical protein